MFDCKTEAIALVLKYFGTQASGLYASYYAGKQDADIIRSVEKLLNGFIGVEKTTAEMCRFHEQVNTHAI